MQSFDDLFDHEKTDRASRDFFWGLFSPVHCECGRNVERDLPRFGLDKTDGRSRLFAKCDCGKQLVLGMSMAG